MTLPRDFGSKFTRAPRPTVPFPQIRSTAKWNFRNDGSFHPEVIMRKSRYNEHQIASALKRAEEGVAVKDICRELGVTVSFPPR